MAGVLAPEVCFMAERKTTKAKPAPLARKKAAKATAKKTAKNPAASKPLPANREPVAKRATIAPPGHGVARLEIKPERIQSILKLLRETYPDAECALDHESPWQLLVATILSAQCTDVRVNMVTP